MFFGHFWPTYLPCPTLLCLFWGAILDPQPTLIRHFLSKKFLTENKQSTFWHSNNLKTIHTNTKCYIFWVFFFLILWTPVFNISVFRPHKLMFYFQNINTKTKNPNRDVICSSWLLTVLSKVLEKSQIFQKCAKCTLMANH